MVSQELDQLLELMAAACALKATEIPDWRKQLDPEAERSADEICLVLSQTGKAPDPMTAAMAEALIPRVQFARAFGSAIEADFDRRARLEEKEASEEEILTWILVTLWHEVGRKAWSEGVLSRSA